MGNVEVEVPLCSGRRGFAKDRRGRNEEDEDCGRNMGLEWIQNEGN